MIRHAFGRLLLAASLLLAAPGWAQLTYSPTPGSGYLPLDGATVRGGINVRLAGCPASGSGWSFAVDGVGVNGEGSCPFDLIGDEQLYDTKILSDGAHTVTATSSASSPYTARFTVANGAIQPPVPPVPGWTGSSTVIWQPPTKNTDGSALTNLSGFRIVYGRSADALVSAVTLNDPGLTRYVLDGLTAGAWSIGMTALTSSGAESVLSPLVSVTLTAPAPVCGAAPPIESRSQTCTPPAVGNWTQTNAWTPDPSATPPDKCWLPNWQPTNVPAGVCAELPPPPPTCPPKPADAKRLAICPAGTTGTFEQIRVQTCLSGVWVQAATYTPLTPPAGSCPVAPSGVWKVAASLALPVYEAVLPSSGSILVRGAQVGTIAPGKSCGAQVFTEGGQSFRTVTASDVKLTSPSYAARTLTAACGLQ